MSECESRITVFFERHIGFGIRWTKNWCYQFEVSVAFPFVTVNIGFGERVS